MLRRGEVLSISITAASMMMSKLVTQQIRHSRKTVDFENLLLTMIPRRAHRSRQGIDRDDVSASVPDILNHGATLGAKPDTASKASCEQHLGT